MCVRERKIERDRGKEEEAVCVCVYQEDVLEGVPPSEEKGRTVPHSHSQMLLHTPTETECLVLILRFVASCSFCLVPILPLCAFLVHNAPCCSASQAPVSAFTGAGQRLYNTGALQKRLYRHLWGGREGVGGHMRGWGGGERGRGGTYQRRPQPADSPTVGAPPAPRPPFRTASPPCGVRRGVEVVKRHQVQYYKLRETIRP